MFENGVPYDGILLDLNSPTIFCEGGRPLCNNDPQPADAESVKRRLLSEDLNTTWYKTYGSEYMNASSTYFLPFIPQKHNLDH